MLRHWIRRHPNVLALLLGCTVALLLLAGAEGAAGVLMRNRAAAWHEQWRYEYIPTALSEPHPLLGLAPHPNAAILSRRVSGEVVAYEVTYHTDAQRRRVTPTADATPNSRAALFLGCSFTWGDGVEDAETLPAQFAGHSPEYAAYNFGYFGYGPQNTYLQLGDDAYFEGIEEPVDLIVYTLIPHHVDRAIGRMRTSTSWGKTLPCLVEDAGGWAHLGTFEGSGLPRQRVYTLLSRSQLLRYLQVDVPFRLRESHFAFTARLLAASRDRARARYPGARFVVLLYPREHPYDQLQAHLEAAGLECVSLTRYLSDGFAADPATLLADRHPSPAGYAAVGGALAQWHSEAGTAGHSP